MHNIPQKYLNLPQKYLKDMVKVDVDSLRGAALDFAIGVAFLDSVSIAAFGPLFGKGYLYPCSRALKFNPSEPHSKYSHWSMEFVERYKLNIAWEHDGCGDKPIASVTSRDVQGSTNSRNVRYAILRHMVKRQLGQIQILIPRALLS